MLGTVVGGFMLVDGRDGGHRLCRNVAMEYLSRDEPLFLQDGDLLRDVL